MDKSSLLKRCAEILAGLIIVATAVVYSAVGVRNAGNVELQSVTDSENGNTDNKTSSEETNIDSSDNASLAMNDSAESVSDNAESVQNAEDSSTLDISRNDEYQNTAAQDTETENAEMQALTASSSNEARMPENVQAAVSETAEPVYKYVNVNLLNVRKGPGSETEIVATLPKATRVQCFDSGNEWVKIVAEDKTEGYVFAEYLSDTAPPVYKYVVVNAVNLRKGPGSDTELLGTVSFGKKVQVFETDNDYVRVLTSDGSEGYVFKDYLGDETVLASRSTSTGQYYNSDLANQIIEYAKQFLGVRYVYGGTSPKGFDCSGFTQYVFKKFNIKLPRTASEYANVGTKVSRQDLKPGDILLFDVNNSWHIGHVGIYIGNDKFIHASSSRGKVAITTLSKYGENLLGIRRVIKQ